MASTVNICGRWRGRRTIEGEQRDRRTYPLIARDPLTGGELLVTRLEGPVSGIVIEGRFSLGWIGRLTGDQLAFVGLLLRNRANVQKVAAELGVAYNTARARLDEIVAALDPAWEPQAPPDQAAVLARLAAGEIHFEEAMRLLRGEPVAGRRHDGGADMPDSG
jgi:hypothetical protein